MPQQAVNQATKELSSSIVWLRIASQVGALSAIAIIISGLAVSTFGLVVIGALFTITSSVGLYYSSQLAYLKDLDEYNNDLANLNASLQQKDLEIQSLNLSIAKTTQDFTLVQNKYNQLVKDDQAAQSFLNNQLASTQTKLQQTAEAFDRAQALAAANLAKKMAEFSQEELKLEKEIEADNAQITLLTQTTDKAKQEIDSLKHDVITLQEALAKYSQQNKEYARQNDRLQQQLKTFSSLPSQAPPKVDVTSINAHAQKLQDLLEKQNVEASKVVKTADQLSAMLDKIDAFNKSTSQLNNAPKK